MSLTLDLPLDIENELREVAHRHGRELGDYILDAALEQARREAQEAEFASRDAALDELTRITEELGLYEHQR